MRIIKKLLKERRYKNRNKILKQILKRVRFQQLMHDGKVQYRVFTRNKENQWEQKLTTNNKAKAVVLKQNLWMLAIRDLGYRPFLTEKRKKKLKF